MATALRPLAGRVVAITGGARGIGRATAAALIARGARVAIGDIDGPLAEQSATELGAGTIGLPLDVTDRDSFDTFLDQAEDRLGPLDVVINNAGIMPVGPFLLETDATAERMIDINVHGVILGSKLALTRFIPRRRGHLVNIASIAGKAGSPHLATYVASKHAVVGLTEALRQELSGTGVDVTVVMPIGVNTELYSGLQQLRGMKTPEPEDVAEAIVEALQTGRYEVYVPKRMKGTIKLGLLMPLRMRDMLNKASGGLTAISNPDHAARAAYEERMARTIAAVESHPAPEPGNEPEAAPPAAEPEATTPAAEPSAPPVTEPIPVTEPEKETV